MSFTVSFHPCRFRGTRAEVFNPFTKQLQETEVPEPLTPAERRAVARVLKIKVRDKDFVSPNFEFSDRGQAEARWPEIGHSEFVSVRIGWLTPELSRFLIDLLKAANWMMLDNNASPIVASGKLAKGLPKDVGSAIVCDSPDELGALLSPGFAEWNTIRNEIANGTRRPGNTPKNRRPRNEP